MARRRRQCNPSGTNMLIVAAFAVVGWQLGMLAGIGLKKPSLPWFGLLGTGGGGGGGGATGGGGSMSYTQAVEAARVPLAALSGQWGTATPEAIKNEVCKNPLLFWKDSEAPVRAGLGCPLTPYQSAQAQLSQFGTDWTKKSPDEVRAKICSDRTLFTGANNPIRKWAGCPL